MTSVKIVPISENTVAYFNHLQFCKNNSIQLEACSPFTRGNNLNHPALKGLEKKYSKTSAQILIRWSLQLDLVVIPKSIHENRIKEKRI